VSLISTRSRPRDMQLHLEGSTSINAPRQSVFSLLTDVNFLARTLPDAEDVRVIDSSSIEAKLRVRLSVVSSTLNVRLTLLDLHPSERASLRAEGSGSGSSLRILSTFQLEGDSQTTMRWSADAEITGIMAGLGSTLLRGFAAKKVSEIFQGITRSIEERTK
jgi:carbon monoxide dehydrogenase subunit G